MSDVMDKTERTRLRRMHERGHFDRETVNGILDAMPLCHVGYILDGRPAVTPNLQWREGNHVYWHSSSASRAGRLSAGADVCLTVSMLDGMVMARSAMHHSVNFRSVMIYGKATKIDDPEVKLIKFRNMIEAYFPGRWDLLRPVSAQETKATMVLSLPIDEASAKVRTGGPKDDEEDYALPIWAGVVPITFSVGAPISDPLNLPGVETPDHATNFRIG
ncbi:pyridoxamine 5'-phosphate oxidase family protein [Rhizobium sp. PAMB 3182]